MPEALKSDSKKEATPYEDKNLPILGRVAVYDSNRSIPRIIDVEFDSVDKFLSEMSQKTYSLSHELGGKIPYTIIKEIIENLIHASFREIIITIMNSGNHLVISDQGPGIVDKEKAFLPGYTSATKSMKKYIRGVGSGLPIVKETITFSGGSIDVEDNIKNGTVVSLRIEDITANLSNTGIGRSTLPVEDKSAKKPVDDFSDLNLSKRQRKILSLILELEEIGPSRIAKELGFSLSTSYRELIYLEKVKLLSLTGSRKRKLSEKGKKYLEYYSNSF
jgi:hypothetical protein